MLKFRGISNLLIVYPLFFANFHSRDSRLLSSLNL